MSLQHGEQCEEINTEIGRNKDEEIRKRETARGEMLGNVPNCEEKPITRGKQDTLVELGTYPRFTSVFIVLYDLIKRKI